MSVLSGLASMSPLTALGLVVAMGGFEIVSRVVSILDTEPEGLAPHAQKYLPVLGVLAIAAVQGLSPAELGWQIDSPLTALGRVVFGTVTLLIASAVLSTVLAQLGSEAMEETAATAAELADTLHGKAFVSGTAGITEEVTFRGYALERLLVLTGSPVFAGGFTLLAFLGIHRSDTWTWTEIATMLVPGILITVLYLWWRSLPVLIAIHALNDFVGLVVSDRMVDQMDDTDDVTAKSAQYQGA